MEVDEKLLSIKIWDTAGQEKFASIAKNYYQRAHGMIVTCALNNRKSFANLKNWLFSIKDNNSNENLPIVIVANKCDLMDEREIRKDEIQCLAKEWNGDFFETSALDGTNVDEAFDHIINKIYTTMYKNKTTESKTEGFKIEENKEGDNRDSKFINCCN